MRVFSKVNVKTFQEHAIAHLEKVLPERCAQAGPQSVRESVETAFQKARGYGLKTELDILRYLNLMYVLGFGFDTDSRYPWAHEILTDSTLASGSKASKLMAQAHRVLAGSEKHCG